MTSFAGYPWQQGEAVVRSHLHKPARSWSQMALSLHCQGEKHDKIHFGHRIPASSDHIIQQVSHWTIRKLTVAAFHTKIAAFQAENVDTVCEIVDDISFDNWVSCGKSQKKTSLVKVVLPIFGIKNSTNISI